MPEEATERDGVLSYPGEWHALALGVAAGYGATVGGRWRLLGRLLLGALGLGPIEGTARAEIQAEPWYYVGGVVIGVAPGLLAHWWAED